MRVALIFDDSIRPDTTGVYCRSAMQQLASTVHLGPEDLASLDGEEFNLLLYIDDGLRYDYRTDGKLSALWAIDTHLDFDWYAEKALEFDFVFTAQRDAVGLLRDVGCRHVSWLPLACDPNVHRRICTPQRHDICFVGHVVPGLREEMLSAVRRKYPDLFVTQRFFDEMASAYSATKIALNRSIQNDINMRVFETLACGCFLMTNDLRDNGQAELFRDGVHLATYGSIEELLDKIDFYLRRDDARQRIAKAGQEEAVAKHTYRHRMQSILEVVGNRRCRQLNPPNNANNRQELESNLRSRKPVHAEISLRQWGTTSIIIPTLNQLAYTTQCLNSIRARTEAPYEIVVVDNGSTDGTVEFLRQQADVLLIENSKNVGFPRACNQGIHAASGSQFLLLNNDVVVSTGWLERMLRALHSSVDIGLVGPVSNCVSGRQQIPVDYEDAGVVEEFASRWASANNGHIEVTERLVGFCMLFRRSVVDTIGLLDEQFGIGNFEDDDFCFRAQQAGLRCAIARDAFVHHFGSVTFQASGLNYAALLDQNERLFRQKWQLELKGLSASPQVSVNEISRPAETLALSLCMIVRDAARTLGACLESIAPWVDEMIVVDTGSCDKTVQIATQFGARVFHFPWPDSFAIARNESIRHARGRWIFWMDADDTISATNGHKLQRLANQAAEESVLGYVMQVHCPGSAIDVEQDVTIVDHVKLFRNIPELRFEGRIHEQVLPAIRRLGGRVEWTDIFVVHSGADHSPSGREAKWSRDLRLLKLELQDRPDHPFAHFNLGMTLADKGEHARAVESLKRSLVLSDDSESHVRKLYALLAGSYAALDQDEAAWRCCEKGLTLYPHDPELLFRKGVLAHRQDRLLEAERAFLAVLERPETERHFSSVDRGIFGYKARHNLALVYATMGQLVDAEMHWWQAVDEAPSFQPGWRALGDNLISQRRLEAADALAERLATDNGMELEALLLRAKLSAAREEFAKAASLYSKAADLTADDTEPLRALCQLLFEYGELADAEHALKRLLEMAPMDASVHHNLGTVYVRCGRFADAVECYRQSLHLRPVSDETRKLLTSTLRRLEQGGGELQQDEHSTIGGRLGNELLPPVRSFRVEKSDEGGLVLIREGSVTDAACPDRRSK